MSSCLANTTPRGKSTDISTTPRLIPIGTVLCLERHVECDITVSSQGSEIEVVRTGRQKESKRSDNILWWIMGIVVLQGDGGYDHRGI